jgi:histidine triad (HIT) family protein
MKNCIFCKIIQKPETENYRILENGKDFLVILDIKPIDRGHSLVIPKKHYSCIEEMGKSFTSLINYSKSFAIDYCKTLDTNSFELKINNKIYLLEEGENHVGHIHTHIIPKYKSHDKISVTKLYFDNIKEAFSKGTKLHSSPL